MQDLVAEYQQYLDAMYVYACFLLLQMLTCASSVEEEGECKEELPVEEEQ